VCLSYVPTKSRDQTLKTIVTRYAKALISHGCWYGFVSAGLDFDTGICGCNCGYMGGVLLANILAVVVFVLFVKKVRRYTAKSWLR
jgi:hypothetical protein